MSFIETYLICLNISMIITGIIVIPKLIEIKKYK